MMKYLSKIKNGDFLATFVLKKKQDLRNSPFQQDLTVLSFLLLHTYLTPRI